MTGTDRERSTDIVFDSIVAEINDIASTKDGVFSKLIDLRSRDIELFTSFGRAFLDCSFSDQEVWRILSLHYIRAHDFDAAMVCNDRHRAFAPTSEEATSRALRIAILRQDADAAYALTASELMPQGRTYQALQQAKVRIAVDEIETMPSAEAEALRDDMCAAASEAIAEAGLVAQEHGPDSVLGRNFTRFSKVIELLRNARSIALVGNGSVLKGRGLGYEIDGHDVVVRINWPKLSGFENDAGQRTSLIFCAEQYLHGETNQFGMGVKIAPYMDVSSLAFDCARTNQTQYPASRSPFPDTICLMPAEVRCRLKVLGYQFATTGLGGIILLTLLLKKDISIYGFDFYTNLKNVYYFDVSGTDPNLVHELAYESWMARSFIPRLLPHGVSEP